MFDTIILNVKRNNQFLGNFLLLAIIWIDAYKVRLGKEAKNKENRKSKGNYQKHSHQLNLSLDNLCYISFLILVGFIAGSDSGMQDIITLVMVIEERQVWMGVWYLNTAPPSNKYLMTVKNVPETVEG